MRHPWVRSLVLGGCALAAVLGAGAAAAQGLDVESVAALFDKQRLGADRAIVMIGDAETGAAGTPAPAAALDGPPPPGAHVLMPAADQVNVRVTFAFDSAVLADDQKPDLRVVCAALDAAGVGVLRIVGHTDARGTAAYNQNLSELRAEEVKRFLVDDCGVPTARLEAIGAGEQFPADAADPEAGVNRRVEFQAIS